jgi:hypothetical protein
VRTVTEKPERTRTARRPKREVAEDLVEVDNPSTSSEVEPEDIAERIDASERPSVPSQSMLAQLMRKAIAGRRRMTEAQEKLREMEFEMRHSDADSKSRFERLRAAALDEYRGARAEAERARRQLASSLRMLPGRQESRTRGAEAA